MSSRVKESESAVQVLAFRRDGGIGLGALIRPGGIKISHHVSPRRMTWTRCDIVEGCAFKCIPSVCCSRRRVSEP